MRTLTLTTLLTIASLTLANPWAANYDTLCLADPYALLSGAPDPAAAQHAHTLTTSILEQHQIPYQRGTCDDDPRAFTLLISLLIDPTNATSANITLGIHQHAPELYDALSALTATARTLNDDDDLAALDHAFNIIDAYSVHIDGSYHTGDDLAALLHDATERHTWLIDSFARSWLGLL